MIGALHQEFSAKKWTNPSDPTEPKPTALSNLVLGVLPTSRTAHSLNVVFGADVAVRPVIHVGIHQLGPGNSKPVKEYVLIGSILLHNVVKLGVSNQGQVVLIEFETLSVHGLV